MEPINNKEKKTDNTQNKTEIEEKKLENVSGGTFPSFISDSDVSRIFESRVERNMFED